jgi:type I restriction enzyme S subunit
MSGAWNRGRLGDVCRVIPGYAFKSSDWQNSGIPVVKIKNIRGDNTVDLSDIDCVPDSLLTPKLQKFVLKDGDILVAMTGATAGKVGRVRAVRPILLNQRVAKILPVEADYGFIWAVVSSDEYQKKFFHLADGAAQPNMSGGQIEGVGIILPPLPIQRRIASILSAYDELIENSQRRIKILEAMARALYREWFVHFRFPGHENHPRIASPLGEIPNGWEVISFEKLLISMSGGDWGSEEPDESESAEVVIVRGTDFAEVAYGGDLRVPVRYIKPSSLKSRSLRVGDVIVENSINAKSRCVGTPLLVDVQVLARLGRAAVAASFCKVFRFHDPSLAPIAHLHLRHLREDKRMEYYQNVAANGIGNFQAQKFAKEENLTVPADRKDRAQLVGRIASLMDGVSLLASQIQNLRRTRDLLLPRLLSGQIDMEAAPR